MPEQASTPSSIIWLFDRSKNVSVLLCGKASAKACPLHEHLNISWLHSSTALWHPHLGTFIPNVAALENKTRQSGVAAQDSGQSLAA